MQSALVLSLGVSLWFLPPQNLDNLQIKVLPVQGNVFMLAGSGGNISLQVGKEGVLMVDTEYAPLAPRIMWRSGNFRRGRFATSSTRTCIRITSAAMRPSPNSFPTILPRP